jgi:large subunit ribosomal protein L32
LYEEIIVGPLPKRRHSRSRSAKRQSQDVLSLKHLVRCQTCGEWHVAHRLCAKCGTYGGKTILEPKEEN